MILLECIWTRAVLLLLLLRLVPNILFTESSIGEPSFTLKLHQCFEELLYVTPLTENDTIT